MGKIYQKGHEFLAHSASSEIGVYRQIQQMYLVADHPEDQIAQEPVLVMRNKVSSSDQARGCASRSIATTSAKSSQDMGRIFDSLSRVFNAWVSIR
jgi:hypothetical protein